MRERYGRTILCGLAIALLPGCSVRASDPPSGLEPGGKVITQEEIQRSGARDAYEVLERRATHLIIQRTRDGSPVRITHRGIDSFLLNAEVLLVIDGTSVMSVAPHLRSIPAETIRFIQILSAREGTPKYGTLAGNGVIVVETSADVAPVRTAGG